MIACYIYLYLHIKRPNVAHRLEKVVSHYESLCSLVLGKMQKKIKCFYLNYILCYNFAKINHGDPHLKNNRKTTPHLTDKILVSHVHVHRYF